MPFYYTNGQPDVAWPRLSTSQPLLSPSVSKRDSAPIHPKLSDHLPRLPRPSQAKHLLHKPSRPPILSSFLAVRRSISQQPRPHNPLLDNQLLQRLAQHIQVGPRGLTTQKAQQDSRETGTVVLNACGQVK